MGKIEKVTLNNEEVFLKKDSLGWRVVEPVIMQNPLTGKLDWNTWNWKNFVSKRSLRTLGVIIFILLICFLAFREQVSNYHKVMTNPCAFCKDCQTYARTYASNLTIKYSNITGIFGGDTWKS